MTAKSQTRVFDGYGQPLVLGAQLGQGGEGIIFEVPQRPDTVAKLYHQQPDAHKASKLSAMVQMQTSRLAGISAWPLGTLHYGSSGPVIGLLMPRIRDYKPVHVLYGPKSRRANFPDATWAFLVHTAANVARAVQVIHDHNVVIGDINHDNVVVSPEATTRLWDCDSFQVASNGTKYLCQVGVETHTPPELQGVSLSTVARTPNHDAFGLAVIIFQLLFMSRHPFSGRYLGPGDMPINRAIREFRFAYGQGAHSKQMAPPPGAPPLNVVSVPVATLFERAFAKNSVSGGRPLASEWVDALTTLLRSLRRCPRHNGHYFLSSLSECPWCSIEFSIGILLFNIVSTGTIKTKGHFGLEAVWAQITAIQSPGPLPPLPTTQNPNISPSPEAIKLGQQRRNRRATAVGISIVSLIFVIGVGEALGWWLFVGSIVVAIIIGRDGSISPRTEAQKTLEEARTRLRAIEERWRTEAGSDHFDAKRRELEDKKRQYESLESLRQQKLASLAARQRSIQLEHFLDRHRIQGARIIGIGPSRTAMLQSYGIETAQDITKARVLAVPGFGPTFTQNLLDWKDSIQRRFVFDPNRGIDPADIAAIDTEIAVSRSRLEQELRAGAALLQQIAQQSRSLREALKPSLEAVYQEVAQAEANFRAMG